MTGGTGFVGSHVTARLTAAVGAPAGREGPEGPDGPALRLLGHRRALPGHTGAAAGIETVTGDLTDPASLRGICEGVTTVVHLAARIGGTEEECRTVNVEGTRALLAEAARAGVRRFVHLGTAAVYRDEPHRGEAEGLLPEEPVSATSVTRLEGERLVLAAGASWCGPTWSTDAATPGWSPRWST